MPRRCQLVHAFWVLFRRAAGVDEAGQAFGESSTCSPSGVLHRSVVQSQDGARFRPPSEQAISASISASAKAETRAPKSLPIYDARWDHRMSRHSYKWDTIHVQRGAVACGDQEPAWTGQTLLYSNCPWAILLLNYYGPLSQDSAWRHRPEGLRLERGGPRG